MKRKQGILFGAVLLLLAVGITVLYQLMIANQTIGTISGAEYEHLLVNGQAYTAVSDAPFRGKDRDRYLGKVKSGRHVFRIYSVSGTEEYLYVRWEHEGGMYRLVPAS